MTRSVRPAVGERVWLLVLCLLVLAIACAEREDRTELVAPPRLTQSPESDLARNSSPAVPGGDTTDFGGNYWLPGLPYDDPTGCPRSRCQGEPTGSAGNNPEHSLDAGAPPRAVDAGPRHPDAGANGPANPDAGLADAAADSSDSAPIDAGLSDAG